MGVVCLDFTKVFDTASYKILIEKLLKYGLNSEVNRKLNDQAWRSCRAKSCWRPVRSRVPQGQYIVQSSSAPSFMIWMMG